MTFFEKTGGAAAAKWNDAELIGDFSAPEVQALLDKRYTVLVGNSSRQKRGTWREWNPALSEMIDRKLSRHEVRTKKDGDAIVFASAKSTGEFFHDRRSGLLWPHCNRSRADIRSISFAGFDIDEGEPLCATKERLANLGKFAILYTTYSHGKSKVGGVE